jgi:two-component system sensor histidine kinase/response regulator
LFTVTDDGIGISEEAQGQLSYVMGQIDEAMDRRYSGIGLGLRYVAFIARYHHGQFSFKSQLGEGSEFYLALPLRSPV